MRIFILFLLLFGAHFALTAIVPAVKGKAWVLWPFARDSQPRLKFLGSSAQTVTQLLSALGSVCLLLAAIGLYILVPVGWWAPLVIAGAIASILLYVLYFGVNALLPLAIDLVMLWGVLIQGWSAASWR